MCVAHCDGDSHGVLGVEGPAGGDPPVRLVTSGPGRGRHRARPRGRRAYAVQEFARDALAVVDAAGGRAHLVGHDWGAATAWVAAMLEPSRVASLTALSVPQPEAFMRSWFTSRQGLKSWYMAAFNVPRLPERLARDEGGFMERLLGGGYCFFFWAAAARSDCWCSTATGAARRLVLLGGHSSAVVAAVLHLPRRLRVLRTPAAQ